MTDGHQVHKQKIRFLLARTPSANITLGGIKIPAGFFKFPRFDISSSIDTCSLPFTLCTAKRGDQTLTVNVAIDPLRTTATPHYSIFRVMDLIRFPDQVFQFFNERNELVAELDKNQFHIASSVDEKLCLKYLDVIVAIKTIQSISDELYRQYIRRQI
jgi:hypothetical protein